MAATRSWTVRVMPNRVTVTDMGAEEHASKFTDYILQDVNEAFWLEGDEPSYSKEQFTSAVAKRDVAEALWTKIADDIQFKGYPLSQSTFNIIANPTVTKIFSETRESAFKEFLVEGAAVKEMKSHEVTHAPPNSEQLIAWIQVQMKSMVDDYKKQDKMFHAVKSAYAKLFDKEENILVMAEKINGIANEAKSPDKKLAEIIGKLAKRVQDFMGIYTKKNPDALFDLKDHHAVRMILMLFDKLRFQGVLKDSPKINNGNVKLPRGGDYNSKCAAQYSDLTKTLQFPFVPQLRNAPAAPAA